MANEVQLPLLYAPSFEYHDAPLEELPVTKDRRQYTDVGCCVFFLLCLAIYVFISINYTYIPKSSGPTPEVNVFNRSVPLGIPPTNDGSTPLGYTFVDGAISFGVAVVFVALNLWILFTFTEIVVWIYIIAGIGLTFLGATVVMLIPNDHFTKLSDKYYSAAVLAGIGLLLLLAVCCGRSGIEFTIKFIRHALTCANNNKSVVVITVLIGVVVAAIMTQIMFLFIGISTGVEDTGSMVAMFTFVLFMFYWFIFLAAAIIRFITYGLTFSYFFRRLDPYRPAALFFLSLALGKHFGTLCCGSLLLAIVAMLKAIAESKDSSDNIGAAIMCCLIRCCIQCCLSAIEYLNGYCYAYTALYGTKFTDSARHAYNLFKQVFDKVITIDSLSPWVFFMNNLVFAAAGGALSYTFQTSDYQQTRYIAAGVTSVLIFFIGNMISSMTHQMEQGLLIASIECDERDVSSDPEMQAVVDLVRSHKLYRAHTTEIPQA